MALLGQALQFCGLAQVLTTLWVSVSPAAKMTLALLAPTMPLPLVLPGSARCVPVPSLGCTLAPSTPCSCPRSEGNLTPISQAGVKTQRGHGLSLSQGWASEPRGPENPSTSWVQRWELNRPTSAVLAIAPQTRVGTHNTDVNVQIHRCTHSCTQSGLGAAVSGGSCPGSWSPFRSINTL